MWNRDEHEERQSVGLADLVALLREAAAEEPFMTPLERRQAIEGHGGTEREHIFS
jgi:hypothetical protein